MPYLDVAEIERRLFADRKARARIERDFGLAPTVTPRELGAALVRAMAHLVPAAGVSSPSPAMLFTAAVRALGSNSRRWSRFLGAESRLRDLLGDFDPVIAAARPDRTGAIRQIATALGAQTGAADARAMFRWADLLVAAPAYGASLDAARADFRGDGATAEESVVLVATVLGRGSGTRLAPPPPKGASSWKTPGMGPVLASEFLRNLGWPGFKPDRHVIRLLSAWVPEVIATTHSRATELAHSLGTRAKDVVDFLVFALVGLAVTPPGRGPTEVDNLVWALGSYIETKRRGTPHPLPRLDSHTEQEAPATVALERPEPAELNALYVALGWGPHSLAVLKSSIAAYTATVCARTPSGLLVGYASVFSDLCLSTLFGEFVVHPEFQRQGIGTSMMFTVENAFPSAPIYVQALGPSREFYAALGFRTPSTPLTCMFRRPESPSALSP